MRIANTGMPVPSSGVLSYARQIAGLYEAIALDLPETVTLLPDAQLPRRGRIEDVRSDALEKLRGLPAEGHEVVGGGRGLRFDAPVGDDAIPHAPADRVMTAEATTPALDDDPCTAYRASRQAPATP
ncbi:hypothetical protein [Kitasatospora acidiphila]|uniref:hypothetical protein n=1 Tax=Kitasatospora acidiphila TaxID=2567942 RepID=UPI003C75B85E